MRRILAILAMLYSFLFPFDLLSSNISSHEYVPMVNENRIWEYGYRCVAYNFEEMYNYVLFQMKFEGEEVRNGKTYHVFKFHGDEIQWSRDFLGEYNNNLQILPNTHADKFLIREEDRRVYLYNDFIINNDSTVFGSTEEFVLYDFNLKQSDKFQAMTLIYDYPRSYIYGDDVLNDHEIVCLDSMIVDGQECFVQYLDSAIPGIFAVEGIGCVDFGILPIYNLLNYVSGFQDSYSLCRVYNTDGEIIFQDPEGRLDVPTSVDFLSEDVYLSYLNGILEVKDMGNKVSVRIYNLSGEVVMAADGYDSVQMDTEELNPGIYIARSGHKTLKLVVR